METTFTLYSCAYMLAIPALLKALEDYTLAQVLSGSNAMAVLLEGIRVSHVNVNCASLTTEKLSKKLRRC